MPANYVLLEKITVGAAGASSVTFSGIPQTGYTDLVVKASARGTLAQVYDTFWMQFNNSTPNYSPSTPTTISLQGSGSAATSSAFSGLQTLQNGATATASTFGTAEFYIPNYTSSNFKSVSTDAATETNATTAYTNLMASLWSDTSAITSITLFPSSGNTFVQGSTFYLYGVAKLGTTPAIVPYATGGDIIDTDGTYWYHTFLSSGTFTPQKSITADYLVVAGGGGAGRYDQNNAGSGGGAGGLRSTVTATGGGGSLETALSLGTSAYTVTVGAGGAGATSTAPGSSGSNSVFATITSLGGGGGYATANNGITGGSGGGAGAGDATGNTGGSGTTGQGYAGGNTFTGGSFPGNRIGSGGGGAGAVGGNENNNGNGGNGGSGVATSISGSSVTYAGGGGGGVTNGAGGAGTGGSGGGGTGGDASSLNGSNGTANRGGGGGGAGGNNTVPATGSAGAGGSGIVIVRYLV
jgi:hypothetical protein